MFTTMSIAGRWYRMQNQLGLFVVFPFAFRWRNVNFHKIKAGCWSVLICEWKLVGSFCITWVFNWSENLSFQLIWKLNRTISFCRNNFYEALQFRELCNSSEAFWTFEAVNWLSAEQLSSFLFCFLKLVSENLLSPNPKLFVSVP